LLEAGARLLLTDILEPDVATERIRKRNYPDDQWTYRKIDVTDGREVNECVQQLFLQHPEIDLVIGLAGGCSMHPFSATSPEEFNRIFSFNYLGQVYVTRAVLSEWVQRRIAGHIIYTSSLVGSLPWVDLSAYCSAKAGIEMLSKCLALEYANNGIRFNCIAPGHVAAGSSQLVYETDLSYREMTDRVIPLKRRVDPQSVADAFVYLCSEMARDINGQVIKVDCGASIPKVG
jgi:NAD(P)-dependent dehydrogenase (short-subunit alcohol dehydrogenase family)